MKRALLLEDCRTAALAAMRTILAQGYAVELYDDVRRAQMACRGKTFDVYVLDSAVRDGSGIDFATWLVSTRPSPRIVIWSATDRSAEASQLGAVFVPKGNREALEGAIE